MVEHLKQLKKHIVTQLTELDSCLSVVIYTIAFGMGVDCSIVYESSILDYPQEWSAMFKKVE